MANSKRLGERFINQIDGLVIWASWLYLNSHVGKLTPENYRYEYVRQFEKNERLLQNTWMVIRLDGRGFTKLTARYNFQKPNDERALRLMNEAAMNVVMELPDVVLAYGQSDEYSFVLHPGCSLFERRESKLVSTIVSMFTAYYIHLWPQFIKDTTLVPPLPSFDGRAVMYPSTQNLKDYMSWRQADCHINNLYNTTFWSLVNSGGLTRPEAEDQLKGTFSDDKNEILFSRFGINYNNEPEMFRKGSVIFRDYSSITPTSSLTPESGSKSRHRPSESIVANPSYTVQPRQAKEDNSVCPEIMSKTQQDKERKRRMKARVVIQHLDIIRDTFWNERPWILGGKAPKIAEKPA